MKVDRPAGSPAKLSEGYQRQRESTPETACDRRVFLDPFLSKAIAAVFQSYVRLYGDFGS